MIVFCSVARSIDDPSRHSDLVENTRLTKAMVRLLNKLNPLRWILEQLPTTLPHIVAAVPYLRRVDLHSIADVSCMHPRVFASNVPLDDLPEFRGQRTTIHTILDQAGILPRQTKIVVGPLGKSRPACRLGPTPTSTPFMVGAHVSDATPIRPTTWPLFSDARIASPSIILTTRLDAVIHPKSFHLRRRNP